DGLFPTPDEPRQKLGLGQTVVLRALTFLGHLANDGEHRSLDRLAHRAICSVTRRAERARERARVDLAVRAQRLGGATDDLREDDPGVAAGAHQRGPRDLLDEARAIFGGRTIELVDHGARRHREVRPGVTVGHGIDVEVVDALAVALERGERAVRELLHALAVARAHAVDLFTSSMRTSTSATGSSVSRSTSYCTRFRSVDATSARFRPYSTTTWSSIVTP